MTLLAASALGWCGGSQPSSAPATSAAAASNGTATTSTRTAPSSTASRTRTTRTTTTATTTTSSHTRRPASRPAAGVPKPPIVYDPIPFGTTRKAEMLAYAERHYGLRSYELIDPHVIVIHFTETPGFESTYNTFAPDTPDPELHELPNTCAHFVIDRDGVSHQLVPLDIMCRHTVGLNYTAIGIEHVGYSDEQVLDDPRELSASLALVHWLRCRFHIAVENVIGHNESLTSPYHHENVPALRTQTHDDFNRADMEIYRAKLSALGGCPA
jgi:N-acetylmuramoyl-L-alanine amidase